MGIPSLEGDRGVSTTRESLPELSEKVLGSAGGLRFMPLEVEVVLGGWHACRAILVCAELGAVLGAGIHARMVALLGAGSAL
jgi:hypothetical protein